jgi:nitrous oxidase accessory protein
VTPALFLAAASLAGEHDVPVVGAIARREVVIPAGAPRDISLRPGDSLQEAIDGLPAGSTVHLGPGTWTGPVVVDRPLAVEGVPGTVLDGGGRGTVLTIAASDVSLRGITVTGGGEARLDDDAGVVVGGDRFLVEDVRVEHVYLGIDVVRASDGAIRRCSVVGDAAKPFGMRGDAIRLWESDRNELSENRIESARDVVIWYSDDTLVRNNAVSHSRYGTHLMHGSGARVEGNSYTDDVVGVFAMYSDDLHISRNTVVRARGEAGVGLGFKESDRIEATGNALVDDTTGIYLDSTPHSIGGTALFRDNLVGADAIGVRMHGPSPGARFEGNDFRDDRLAASVDGAMTDDGVVFDQNRWSEYAGYDLDGDGIGDLPYEARAVTGRLTERRPALAWFAGTPAAALLELFARAFPMFAPAPVLVDLHPSLSEGVRP